MYYTVNLKFGVAAALALLAVLFPVGSSSFLHAAEVDSFDDALSRKVFDLSKSGKCREAWNIIWPQVLRGSNRASLELVGAMIWGNINPPLSSLTEGDDVHLHEHTRFIADIVFLIDPSETLDIEEAASFKREFLGSVWDKRAFSAYKLLNCPTGSDKSVCLNPEKWIGIVTKLADWDKKFQSNERAGLTARCRGQMGKEREL